MEENDGAVRPTTCKSTICQLRPPSPSMLFPLPILVSPTCPQHGLLARRTTAEGGSDDDSSPMHAKCSALLDGFPPDRTTLRMAFTLGLCKLFSGIVVFLLGVAAFPLQATLSSVGIGLWAGMVTLVSGVAGLLCSKLPRNYAVLVAFLCWSITSMATSSLLVVFSATGLANDVSRDGFSLANVSSPLNGTGDVDQSMFSSLLRFRTQPAVVVNTSLVLLSMVDCLVSFMSIVLASSETCPCCRSSTNGRRRRSVVASAAVRGWPHAGRSQTGKIRHDRVLRWLHHQRLKLLTQQPIPYNNCEHTSSLAPIDRNHGVREVEVQECTVDSCSYVAGHASIMSVDSLTCRKTSVLMLELPGTETPAVCARCVDRPTAGDTTAVVRQQLITEEEEVLVIASTNNTDRSTATSANNNNNDGGELDECGPESTHSSQLDSVFVN